ncbi:MAG: TRAP transporter small permease subunit [Pseudomonadota bacterium]
MDVKVPMLALTYRIEQIIEEIGHGLAWLVFVMMLCVCATVLLRSGFHQGHIALQESVTYCHAALFMIGASFALKHDAHVRVDVFYQRMSPRTQHWVNALGIICFLFPMTAFIALNSLGFVDASWAIRETSADPGGLPFVYLLKTLIPLMAAMLFIQGMCLLTRHTASLMGMTPDGNAHD